MSIIRMLPSRLRVFVARLDQEGRNFRQALQGERARGCRFDEAPIKYAQGPDSWEFQEPIIPFEGPGNSEASHAAARLESDLEATASAIEPAVAVIEFSRSGIEVRVEDLEQTMLNAGLEAGVDLLYSCTLGGCAACILDIIEGEVEYENPSSLCLTDDEIETGDVCLACVARPRGRIVIDA